MESKQINKLIKDTLEGLQQLFFQKITHRDINPSNILYMQNGDFKLGDFGTSRVLNNEDKSITLIGTPSYFPPEARLHYKKGRLIQLSKEKSKEIDWHGFDTYSLGLSFAAAVCQIQSMGEYCKNIEPLKKLLEETKEQKIYDSKVFEIINLMIQYSQKDRPTPGELIRIANGLEIE